MNWVLKRDGKWVGMNLVGKWVGLGWNELGSEMGCVGLGNGLGWYWMNWVGKWIGKWVGKWDGII